MVAYSLGMVAEWVGVHTSWLFGDYAYGPVLGRKIGEIPLVMGCNWVTVLAGAVSFLQFLTPRWQSKSLIVLRIVLIAALTAAYDWLLEPIAIRLDYWHWLKGEIPIYNYACWFGLSLLLASLWERLKIAPNSFAVFLFWVQAAFFILLRLLL